MVKPRYFNANSASECHLTGLRRTGFVLGCCGFGTFYSILVNESRCQSSLDRPNSRVCGSFVQGFKSALASGNSDLNKLTIAAILLVTSKPLACSAAFTQNLLWLSSVKGLLNYLFMTSYGKFAAFFGKISLTFVVLS
jgi:hypothetical protein